MGQGLFLLVGISSALFSLASLKLYLIETVDIHSKPEKNVELSNSWLTP
jgi:hypothetical protein